MEAHQSVLVNGKPVVPRTETIEKTNTRLAEVEGRGVQLMQVEFE